MELFAGPCDGGEAVIPADGPRFVCRRVVAVWHHYERASDDVFGYAGECTTVDHDGAEPREYTA